MFKSLIGNALFAGCVVAWFIYADGDRSLMLSGTILAFGCFLSGIFMGYILHTPRGAGRGLSRTRQSAAAAVAPAGSEEIEPTNAEDAEEEIASPVVAAAVAPEKSGHKDPDSEEEMYDLDVPAASETSHPSAPEDDEVAHRNAMESQSGETTEVAAETVDSMVSTEHTLVVVESLQSASSKPEGHKRDTLAFQEIRPVS